MNVDNAIGAFCALKKVKPAARAGFFIGVPLLKVFIDIDAGELPVTITIDKPDDWEWGGDDDDGEPKPEEEVTHIKAVSNG